MGITLTKGQLKAKNKLKKWYKNKDEQVFKIAGYAGTGKTTIVFDLINELGLDPRKEVLFATYVGKATLPLRKQHLLAKTLHKAFYDVVKEKKLGEDGLPIIGQNGRAKTHTVFKLKKRISSNIKLIVLDEAAMIPSKMSNDAKTFDRPIIALGDAGQLEPVFGKSDLLKHPDVILDEIMRQQKGDPIIFLSMLAREGKDIPIGKYGDNCYVVDETILKYPKIYTRPDIILCGKNKTRDNINNIVRHDIKRYKSAYPEIGDKMVCRKNNWDEDIDDIALINGLFGYVVDINDESFNGKSVNINFMPECLPNQWYEDIELDYNYLKLSYELRKEYNAFYSNGNLFEYGYASTVHLAQGSQYGYVLLLEEKLGSKDFQNKWMYTGITRAKQSLVIVKRKRKNQSYFF